MKRFHALALVLAVSAAGCASNCPPVDEAALARRVVDALLHTPDAPPDGSAGGEIGAGEHATDIASRIPFDELPRRGPADADVRMVVISDFECPFCGRYEPTLERALDDYEGRVAIYFIHFPLPFHPHAHLAAEAAVEARAQGGDAAFYRMHDRMFASQRSLELEDLVAYAVELGLDGEAMRRALDERTHAGTVDADIELAESLDVSGTPLTIVGEDLVYGAVDYDTLRRAIEAALHD